MGLVFVGWAVLVRCGSVRCGSLLRGGDASTVYTQYMGSRSREAIGAPRRRAVPVLPPSRRALRFSGGFFAKPVSTPRPVL